MTDAVSDERYYYEERIVDEDFVSCIGRRLGMASKGFSKLTSEVCALEFGSTSVFFEVGLSVSLVLPLSVFCTWVTVTLQFTFGWEIYAFISFLLEKKVAALFDWRTHCRAVSIAGTHSSWDVAGLAAGTALRVRRLED